MGANGRIRQVTGLVALVIWSASTGFATSSNAGGSGDKLIPRDDVRKYYEVMQKMDEKIGDHIAKLVDRFGDKDAYTPAEIQWPIGAKKSKEDLIYVTNVKRQLPVPHGAYSSQLAHTVL